MIFKYRIFPTWILLANHISLVPLRNFNLVSMIEKISPSHLTCRTDAIATFLWELTKTIVANVSEASFSVVAGLLIIWKSGGRFHYSSRMHCKHVSRLQAEARPRFEVYSLRDRDDRRCRESKRSQMDLLLIRCG